ncbi:MAG: metallophosphoesterase [Ruminococcus sp.]|nr:metallophosphoesterase [Ruminococcus sp.]
MSDIHGCLSEFLYALSLVDLSGTNKLILLGDYIHYGDESHGVLDKIMELQDQYGNEKVVAIMGNHEEMVISGYSSIEEMVISSYSSTSDRKTIRDEIYENWMSNLPLYHVEDDFLFCHAGIEEEAGEEWEWATGDLIYTGKYPAQIGKFDGGMMIVAGHVGTSGIADDPQFHGIYYDGLSHYYIDGTVIESRNIPVLKVDTETKQCYTVTEHGDLPVYPYDPEW